VRKRITAFIDFFRLPLFQFIPEETFRYLFCGVSTIVVDWVAFYISFHFIFSEPILQGVFPGIKEVLPETASLIIAFICSFVWGFGLNKYVVFTASPLKGRVQLFRYGIITSTCIIFNFILMKFFIRKVGMYATFARIVTSLIVAVYSYIVQRTFTFKVKKTKE
jgi:putative flippase GtrA